MSGFRPLPLKMHDGRPLPHTFHETEGKGLLVVLPGLHYGPDGPVLYLLAKEMQAAGWDTLGLSYGFQAAMSFPWTDHAAGTLAECRAALAEAASQRPYDRKAVVGKSLGTVLLVQLCLQGAIAESTAVAHLTPPIGSPAFDTGFVETRQPAYLAIGSRDSYYDEDAVRSLAGKRQVWLRVLPGADHGLDVAGDLQATLGVVGQVVKDVAEFFLTGRVAALG